MLCFQPPEMNFGQAGIGNKLKRLTLFKQSCFILFSYLFFGGALFVSFFFFLIIIPIEGLWSRWVLQNYKWIAYRISNLDCKCTWHFETKTQPVLLRNRSLLSPKGGVRLGITPAELTVNVVLPMISQNYYFCANRFNFFYWLLFMSKGICPCNWCFAAYQHYMCFFKKSKCSELHCLL